MQEDCITISLGLPEFRVLGVYEDGQNLIIYLAKKKALGVLPSMR